MRREPTFHSDRNTARNDAPARAHHSHGAGAAVLRATGVAFDNPVAAGGTLVMLLTASLIVANALSFQPGKHPAPLFATRDTGVEQSVQPERPKPSELVTDLQNSLTRMGYYAGPVDGLDGPRTQDAIRAYERASGLAVTGRPSHALRARLILEDVALPRTAPTPPASSSSSSADTSGIPLPPADIRDQNQATDSIGTLISRDTVSSVQRVLLQLGYGPITVDGLMGGETASAVRRFELDCGMPIDGQLDERLYAALEKASGEKIPR
ncbi:peptidoglycan-binding domain-containing protein [Breoghania sp.]|uniref:peptidoglycan-binding domain-containing protein n=1 Tax=Breoghania sp. TaxID=2065378 RepID=UPI00262DB127|nr:peptidoglycan-binding domain-containing protein [Breoghania sp.]MDJ0931806.1 peptidoglycan-binding domain-containing protein [Breoghania sp.]